MHGKSRVPQQAHGLASLLALAAVRPATAAPLAGLGESGLGLTELLIGLALLASLAALLLSRLQARKKQVETALNALPDAVIQLDATGDLHFLNPAGATLLGLAAGGTDGTPAAWSFIDHATR
ncbi:MAG: hypothetical protein HGA75_14285, partial [Thiobacillus sp.]|nr:hypothetical protein [Thiobacillus sp.]